MADYVKYGDVIRLTNGYGGNWKGGYLCVGGPARVDGGQDYVGTVSSLSGNETATQWIIVSPLNQKPKGQNVVSCDQILLQSVKDNSYLALFNNNANNGQNLDVATSGGLGGTGSVAWHIFIRSNPQNDPKLITEDQLFLLNSFNNGAGFLDTRGEGQSGFLYNVSASLLVDREGSGSGAWMITRG
ncbi:hypothetical protein [Burkholderia territorii]|uniref:Calcium-mediated lectin domain-containing protein n=1 Tax=Burkholderia territorii TaxID=1503055 RepID=A0A119GKY1_9BURK|nr:hypothetical protein [Burkholderia territorii]AOI65236.1 hypothetical protein WS51_16555 [Burkholderia territorii]KAB0675970.1 hypothetical protein F7R13_13755 [Burkholderia territorii]KUY94905.1 hypothetical protein WS47_11965 [Burkholderia territorii]KUZ04129.1 hypothetical protein WS50_03105 [Burkholderia territorii]KUZ35181.1 hypothetical protein WS52_04250 [Burkholderia territorii]